MKKLYELGKKTSERELLPCDSRKSFYGKARACEYESGARVLFSYNTPVLAILEDGERVDLWGGWSATTGRHIASFCGMNKAEYMALARGHKFGHSDGLEFIELED